jgi:alanine-glyoxylate transaminase / serine-glyoxylate transaminase / serine-pyruvate transaminase
MPIDANQFTALLPPVRILLGPGPSMIPNRVLEAMRMPTVGHLDPYFQQVMEDVKLLLRYVFQTRNEFTIPVSGTGSAGMEAALCNFIEPGDRVLIAINGYFGERMAQMAARYGAEVDRLERPWGEAFDPDDITTALKSHAYKLLSLVHCETSTGVLQPHIAEIAAAAHQHGALLVLDTVASLGGTPVEVDAWAVDVCYSGSQKCLSAPPGLAPLTLSPQARHVLKQRRTPVTSWYLDLSALETYWGSNQRVYHHTAPINLNYALREALLMVLEEGIKQQIERHQSCAQMLWEGLEALDLPPSIPPALRSPTLTTPTLPPGVDDVAVRRRLLDVYNIEISGGFGPLAGQIWRIGLMGHSACHHNVRLLLNTLEAVLKK